MIGSRNEALDSAVVAPLRQLAWLPSISPHWIKYGTW